jgi:hypothetical protein
MTAKKPIRMFVRKPGAAKFLGATGEWTRRIEAACNFPNALKLVHACLAKGLEDVELVVHYEGDPEARYYCLNLA